MSGFGDVVVKQNERNAHVEHVCREHDGLMAELAAFKADNQRLMAAHVKIGNFFSQLNEETRKPHFGEREKSIIRALLLRAQESDVYHPNEIE